MLWLRGDADRELVPGEEGRAPPEVIEATRAALTPEQIEFLSRLPPTVQIGDVLFCHPSPRNDVDIFTERTPEKQIAALIADVDGDVVVCGHTHTRFERKSAGRRLISSGSVGMPYEDGAPTGRSTSGIGGPTTREASKPEAGREGAVSYFESVAVPPDSFCSRTPESCCQ